MRTLRSFPVRLACLAVLPMFTAACSVSMDTSTHDIVRPINSSTTTSTPTATPSSSDRSIVYLLSPDGVTNRLVAVEREATTSVEELLTLLLAGPTADERSRQHLETAIPIGVRIRSMSLDDDGLLVIDLDRDFEAAETSSLVTAVGQIVATVSTRPDVRRVRLLVDGASRAWILPSGATTSDALSSRDFATLLTGP